MRCIQRTAEPQPIQQNITRNPLQPQPSHSSENNKELVRGDFGRKEVKTSYFQLFSCIILVLEFFLKPCIVLVRYHFSEELFRSPQTPDVSFW